MFDDARPLDRSFYDCDPHELAEKLLGKTLVRKTDDAICAARLVEVEVYGGIDDPACHADSGRPTPRTESMFGDPGQVYVYTIYGMYQCLNVVAAKSPRVAALLIRAAEPLHGVEAMAIRRGLDLTHARTERNLASGPGKLCQAMAIDRAHDGLFFDDDALFLTDTESNVPTEIDRSTRIGLNRETCGACVDFEWRYTVAGSRFLSR